MGSSDDSSESEELAVAHRGGGGALRLESEKVGVLKVAVLFGNDHYVEPWTKLTCCKSDVRALMPELNSAGLLPVQSCDVTSDEFWECIDDASKYVSGATKVVFFHWSGHGQYDDRTWLITTDGKRVDLHEALEKLLSKTTRTVTTFVILDCCRNAPATASSESSTCEGSIESETKKSASALWRKKCEEMYAKAPQGRGPKRRKLIFFFATGLGEPAREVNGGRHGVLTRAVLEHLFKEGDLSTIIGHINEKVQFDTNYAQHSWVSSNAVVVANPIMFNQCCFEVEKEASRKIRQKQKLTQKYWRQLQQSKEKLEVASSHRDSVAEALPPELHINPPRSPSLQASRRASNSSTCCSLQDGKKLWIAIDGNIGVGKTSLLMDEFIREISPKVETLAEPAEKWSLGPLKKIYNPASSTSDVFQAQMEIWHHFQGMADKFLRLPDNTIYLTERSPISVLKIFCQNFLDEDRIGKDHFEMFRSYFQLLQQREVAGTALPTHYVLLEANVSTCQERIRTRNRNGEQEISDEYLKNIQALLGKVYKQVEDEGTTVIRINTEEPEEVVKTTFLEKMRAML